jgi:type II secretory pathway pseudopilin PulG
MSATSEDGFTIVETLVALMVLAFASVMFARSVSDASTQLQAADKLVDAASLCKRLLAEAEVRSDDILEGFDEASGLAWIRRAETVVPGSPDEGQILVLVSVEVYKTKTAPAILKISTVKSGAY